MSRVVVITGASSGIGLELKKLFKDNGDTVLTISRSEGDGNHYIADVAHEIKVRQVFNDIKEKYGKIDILINNAGVGMSGVTELVPIEDIQRVVDVNMYGVLHCVRSALPLMSEGGKIINMSSAMALFPVPFRAIYGAVKSAILNLSFSLRMELKPLGIDVCAICPGDIKTNFTANRFKNFDTNERYGARIKTATEKYDGREDKRMAPEKCGLAIFKAINKNKLKPFYIIGGKYKFLNFLTRITPKSLLLNITASLMNGSYEEKKKKKTAQTPVAPVEDKVEKTDTTLFGGSVVTEATPIVEVEEKVENEIPADVVEENAATSEEINSEEEVKVTEDVPSVDMAEGVAELAEEVNPTNEGEAVAETSIVEEVVSNSDSTTEVTEQPQDVVSENVTVATTEENSSTETNTVEENVEKSTGSLFAKKEEGAGERKPLSSILSRFRK